MEKAEAATLPQPRFPALRWILFLPVGFLAGLSICTVLGAIELLMRVPKRVFEPQGEFLLPITIVIIATAVAPARKQVVATAVGSFFIMLGLLTIAAGIFRPLIAPWLMQHYPFIGFRDPEWLQMLNGLAALVGSLVAIAWATRRP